MFSPIVTRGTMTMVCAVGLLLGTALPALAAPATPTQWYVVGQNGRVAMGWDYLANLSWKIKRSTSSGGPYTTIATITANNYFDTDVANGTTYYYIVTANDGSGESTPTGQLSGTPRLTAPTNVSATAGDTQVTINWTPVAYATGYVVKRGTSSGSYTLTQSVSGGSSSSHTWTGLTNGTTYYFVVQATTSNPNGNSGNSSQVSKAPVVPVPSAPANVHASAGDAQVSVSWDSSSGATSYKVKRSTTLGGAYSVVGTPTTSPYTDTGLTNGTMYYYVVSAVGAGGESGNSSQVSGMPQQPLPGAPGAPGVSHIAATSLRVTAPILPANADSLTLQKKLTGQSDATYTNVATGLAALAETDVTGLAAQTGYTLRYLAVNAAGSVAGAGMDATTLPSPPAAPTALAAVAGDGQVTLSWEAATGAVTYRVERSAVTGGPYALVSEGITGLGYTDTTITNGTTYFYIVSGVNAGGTGDPSNQASATPLEPAPDAPGAPVVSEIAATQLKATAPALPTRADTLTLQKKLASAPDTDYVNVATSLAGAAETTVTGLEPATAYSFRYVAVGDGGSTPGAATEATTLPNPPPAPQNLAATAGDGEVGLSWSISTGAATYIVKRAAVDGGPYATVAAGVTAASYQDTGLTNGTTYYYVVSAVNSGGESGHSNQAAATPQIPAPVAPGLPTFSAITASALTAHLPAPPARAATLRLQRKLAGESDAAYVTIAEDLAGASTVAVTALAAATEYAFRVVAVGAGGTTLGAGATVTTLADPPAAPAAPTISEITANSLRVTAPALPLRAASLTLQKKLASEGDESYSTVAADLAAGAETVVTGLLAQTTYAFRYVAVGAGGSTAGASANATTLPNAPAAPQNVAATPGDAQVALSWDAVTGATGYQVRRSTTDGGPYSVVAANVTATSYLDTTVTNGTTYYYVVVAFNAGGESGNSDQVSATPQIAAPDAPDAPTYGDITASTLTAQLPALPARASSLRLERKLSGAGDETYVLVSENHPANASVPVTGLLAATGYDFRVVAVGAGGSTPGAGASVTTLPNPPAAPTALQATGGDEEVQLSWTGAPGATGYNLKRSLVEGGPYTTISANVAGQSSTDTGVTNGTTYFYVVSAINSGGESGPSNEASATPQVAPPAAPGDPSFSEITATGLKVTAPILPGGAATLTLQKKLAAEPDTAYTNVATELAALAETVATGLQPATEYSFRYVAVNAGGGTAGAGANATTLPDAPVAPLNLTAVTGDGQVALSWDAAAGAVSYAVKRATVDGGPYTTIAPNHALTLFTDTGLVNGTRYYYVVSAINSGGTSPDSGQADAMPLPPVPAAPDAPVISGITATGLQAAAPALPTNANSLSLQKKLLAAGDETYTVVAENLAANAQTAVTGLLPETSYSFRYIAVGLGGSTPGAVAQATTLPSPPNPPAAPQNLFAIPGNAQVSLSWDAVVGATGYTIKHATVDGGPYDVVEQGATQTIYTNTGLTNGTTYFYIVTAVNADGESAASNQASATPSIPPVDPPAESLAPTFSDVSSTSLTVYLPALPARATSFSLQQKLSVDGDETYVTIETDLDGGSEVPVTGLLEATTYAFRCVAVSEGGSTPGLAATVTTTSGGSGGGPNPDPSLLADLLVRDANEVDYIGDNLYSTTAAGQVVSQVVDTDETTIYQVQVQNDSAQSGSFVLTAPASGTGWTVRYHDALAGGSEITAQITSGTGWSTGALAPGAFRELRVEITPDATVAVGSSQNVLISVQNNGVAQDAVKLTAAHQTSGPQPDLSIRLLPRAGEELSEEDAEPKGVDVYNNSLNSVRAEQVLPVVTTFGLTSEAAVKIHNTGVVAASYKITLPPTPTGWEVHLFDALESGTDITTAALDGAGWQTPQIAPAGFIELKLSVTSSATAEDSYETTVRAEIEDLHDGVALSNLLQGIAKIEWRNSEGSWSDTTASTPLALQYVTIGFRAVKRLPDQPWIGTGGGANGTLPIWTVGGKTYEAETLWIPFSSATMPGDPLQSLSAVCGNSKTAQVKVRPNVNVRVSAGPSFVLAGAGPAALKQVQLSARVEDAEGNAVSGLQVRFRCTNGSGAPVGEINETGQEQADVVTGAGGTAQAMWTSGSAAGTVTVHAEVLQTDGSPLDVSDATTIDAALPYLRLDYGQWQEDATGNWSRSVQASVWFWNEKLAGRGVQLSSTVLLDGVAVAGNPAPLDATAGTTNANGVFVTTQRWNPPQEGEWPHDYEITVNTSLAN